MCASRISPWKSFNEFFISIVYFVQGSAGILGWSLPLLLRDVLQLDFYQMGLIAAATLFPWLIKPVYGLLTDLVPIGKFRRRPYLHIGPLIGVLGYVMAGLYGNSFESIFIYLLIANLGLALTDVATDGFVVEESTEENAARLQGVSWGGYQFAGFITVFLSGFLVYEHILTYHQMFYAAAFFPLLTFTSSFFVKEKTIDEWTFLKSSAEKSITAETTWEHYKTKRFDTKIFSSGFLATLLVIFFILVFTTLFGDSINDFMKNLSPALSKSYLTTLVWSAFFVWLIMYFNKLKKLEMASPMIFLALLFVLLYRINPGTGGSFDFYVRNTLGVSEETQGYIGAIAQLGAVIAVIFAVKIFDKFDFKRFLYVMVSIGAAYGLTSFAITRPVYAEWIASFSVVSWLGSLIAVPAYFLETVFDTLFLSKDFVNPITTAFALPALVKFLYVNSIIGSFISMLVFLPIMKFAVLITPKKAEATNYAIIASVMNIGLSISAWIGGFLYNTFMGIYHPDLDVASIQVDVIEILIWVSIITSLMCLAVLPFLKTKEFRNL